MKTFKAAAIQLTSGDDIAANIAALERLMAQAVSQGATLVTTPENVFYMRREGTARMVDGPMLQHPGIEWACAAAKRDQIWLLIGSIRAREPGMEKPFNRSVVIAPDGQISAHYDKIHLFDVTLADGHSYTESSQATAGYQAALAETPMAALGLSICYDVRFPALYRQLALKGATVLTVPSAFTRPTGRAHWHTLLKARAIENACYVIAPAQCGTHPGGRETYGHSLIIDPWGTVLAEASADRPEVIVAELHEERVAEVRSQIPVLAHHKAIG